MELQAPQARMEREDKKLYVERIGTLFHAVRKKYQYSQKEFSAGLSISQGFLSKIEACASIPDVIVWLNFCEKFKLSPSVILSDREYQAIMDKFGGFQEGELAPTVNYETPQAV